MREKRALRAEPLNRLLEGLDLKLGEFEMEAEQHDTPEEMAHAWQAGIPKERAYLLIFELWRRLFPERQSLSVFCDELDHQIELYDCEEGDTDLQDSLAYLQHILDESVDAGASPKEAFQTVQSHCREELEPFLYAYIADQIEEGCARYAHELLDGFTRYMAEPIWFAYLTTLCEPDPQERFKSLETLSQEKAPLPLLLEILSYLSTSGNPFLFKRVVLRTLPLIEAEADFQDLTTSAHTLLTDLGCTAIDPLLTSLSPLPEKITTLHKIFVGLKSR